MPVTKGLVRKLVDRLCTLPSASNEMFDSPAEAKAAVRAELGRAIERHCGTDVQANNVVENLLTGRFRPVPAEIRDAAALVPQQEATPEGCEVCEGQPWVTVEKVVSDRFTGAKDENGVPLVRQMTRMGSKRCDCAKGRWFQQKDRENEAKRRAGVPV